MKTERRREADPSPLSSATVSAPPEGGGQTSGVSGSCREGSGGRGAARRTCVTGSTLWEQQSRDPTTLHNAVGLGAAAVVVVVVEVVGWVW